MSVLVFAAGMAVGILIVLGALGLALLALSSRWND